MDEVDVQGSQDVIEFDLDTAWDKLTRKPQGSSGDFAVHVPIKSL
jgi:hypothetical protein